MTAPLPVALRGVSVYRGRDASRSVKVIDGLDLDIAAGERLAVVGPNGAGKTSLLLALVGAAPSAGAVRVGDAVLAPETLRTIRRRVTLVFAEPADQLFTDTAFDEVAFGPRQRGVDADIVTQRTRRALHAVGLDGVEAQRPHTLSLGQQRRLAIATALTQDVGVVLCDEPTAGLDPLARRAVLAVLGELEETLVFATHDLEAARAIASQVVVLRDGRVTDLGPPSLLLDPAVIERGGLG